MGLGAYGLFAGLWPLSPQGFAKAYVVLLCWLISFVLKRAEKDDLSAFFFVASIWLPLVLINLERLLVLVLVTGLAIYFSKDSLRGFFQNNPRQGTTEKEVDGSGVETHTEYYENGPNKKSKADWRNDNFEKILREGFSEQSNKS